MVNRDTAASWAGVCVFSLALGVATVALPLLALRAGYTAAEVGVLTAISAFMQMAVRLVLGAVMRHTSDWTLVAASGLLLALSNGIVVASTAIVPFVVAETLQGIARACFWTGAQTHVVRGPRRPVRALATMNLAASVGQLGGPVLAGVLAERSPTLALTVSAGIALAGVIPTFLLDRLPPFDQPADRPPGRLWRRPGVDAACWAGVATGAWRGLLSSYVPVVLDAARQTPSVIGGLVAVANLAALAGSVTVAYVRPRTAGHAFVLGMLGAGAGTAATGFLAGSAVLAGIALTVSGLGAGFLQTLSPAIATDVVHPQERGDAIATTGTFRAAALFAAPLAVAAAIGTVGLVPALAGAGVLIAAPVLSAKRLPPPQPGG